MYYIVTVSYGYKYICVFDNEEEELSWWLNVCGGSFKVVLKTAEGISVVCSLAVVTRIVNSKKGYIFAVWNPLIPVIAAFKSFHSGCVYRRATRNFKELSLLLFSSSSV